MARERPPRDRLPMPSVTVLTPANRPGGIGSTAPTEPPTTALRKAVRASGTQTGVTERPAANSRANRSQRKTR